MPTCLHSEVECDDFFEHGVELLPLLVEDQCVRVSSEEEEVEEKRGGGGGGGGGAGEEGRGGGGGEGDGGVNGTIKRMRK